MKQLCWSSRHASAGYSRRVNADSDTRSAYRSFHCDCNRSHRLHIVKQSRKDLQLLALGIIDREHPSRVWCPHGFQLLRLLVWPLAPHLSMPTKHSPWSGRSASE